MHNDCTCVVADNLEKQITILYCIGSFLLYQEEQFYNSIIGALNCKRDTKPYAININMN